MDWAPIVILVLLVLLTVMTVIGHGIWVLLATIFGGGRSKAASQPCGFCGRPTPVDHAKCDWCGRDQHSALVAELADLLVVERQLRRFREKGAMKPEVADNLLKRLRAYRQQLLEPARQATAPILAEAVREPAKPQPPAVVMPQAPAAATPQTPVAVAVQASPPVVVPAQRQTPVRETAGINPAARLPVVPRASAPAAARLPAAPRKSWNELLAAFMEESNIRWGELIGGLLLVCSSVMMVVSLWRQLQQIPYIQSFIFLVVSAAVFGVGLYAHHRWKLAATSRGLLLIGMLLVPLNFVAMAVLSGGVGAKAATGVARSAGAPMIWTMALVSLAIFAWLTSLAARILVPKGWPLTVAAVVGDSATMVAMALWIHASASAAAFFAAAALPVALFWGAVGTQLFALARGSGAAGRRKLDLAQITTLLTLLGVTAFATFVALGLLVAQAADLEHLARLLTRFSLLVVLAALPALAAGLTVMRATAGLPSSARSTVGQANRGTLHAPVNPLGPYHLAGTSIALLASVLMLAALVLAWPQPGWLIAVGALDAAALAVAAFRWRLPLLHAGAIACAALVYLIVFHLATGAVVLTADRAELSAALLRAALSAESGVALAGLLAALAAAAEVLVRLARRRHAFVYLAGAAVTAIAGLVLTTFHGIFGHSAAEGAAVLYPDALRAAILYGVYGAGSLALVARWRRRELSFLGVALLAAAPAWALWCHSATHQVGPLWAAVLAGEALAMAVAAAVLQYVFGAVPLLARPAVPEARLDKPTVAPASLPNLYRVPLAYGAEVLAAAAFALGAATCWLQREAILALPTPAPVVAAACLAAVFFLMAWQYRSPERTWIASCLVLAGLVHSLNFNYTALAPQPWLVALLAHGTAAVAAALLLDLWARKKGTGYPLGAFSSAELRRVLGRPLADSALLSSALVVPALWLAAPGGLVALAICLFWLAAIWLVLAWRAGDARLLAAHQAALTAATLVAATAWMQHQGWIAGFQLAILGDPRHLQVYGVSLAVLSLLWVAVRIAGRMPMAGRIAFLRDLVREPRSVDRGVRYAVMAAQWLLLVAYVLPGEVFRELVRGLPAAPAIPTAFGPAAWILLALLAVAAVAALWDRWGRADLVGTLLVIATAPCLAAGPMLANRAAASTLRWGLAVAFVAVAAAVWQRGRLMTLSAKARAWVAIGAQGPMIARIVLLATTALPVVGLTVLAAGLRLAGWLPAGPAAGTFFANLGPLWSGLVPLLLVIAGLVGFAVRERSAGYAFSAGLVLELAVTLGYALATMTGLMTRPPTVVFWVTLLQLATITAAAWGIAWLLARQALDVWREGAAFRNTVLMNVQLGMAGAGNFLLLGWALLLLVFAPPFGHWQDWSVAAGLPWGWLALALAPVAWRLRGRLRPQLVGLAGMAALGLLACTVRGLGPYWHFPAQQPVDAIWGYRTLMLGWAVYALLVVAATWWVASLRTLPGAAGPPQAMIRMAAVWVRAAGILAVLLGLKAAFWPWHDYREELWAAAAIAVASVAGATMAVWRRREGWAFAAALGVNLAASLVVWHFQFSHALEDWWLRLVEANVIASAAVALAWLAARRRLYQLHDLTLGQSPLLALQVALPAAGCMALLALPVGWLVCNPAGLPAWTAGLATAQGWIGLLAAAAAAGWYLRHTLSGHVAHVLGFLLLGVGVLLACHAGQGGYWFGYHVLTTAWAAATLALLGLAMSAEKFRVVAPELLFPRRLVQAWVTWIGGLAVLLATIYALHDPFRPGWSVRAIVAVAAAAAVVALWLRRPTYVFLSCLLLNLSGTILWWSWSGAKLDIFDWDLQTVAALVQANVIALAIGSMIWTLLKVAHREAERAVRPFLEPAAQGAAQLGACLLATLVAVCVVWELAGLQHVGPHRLDWIALAAVTLAAAACLWDRRAGFVLPVFYALGLSGLGMELLALGLPRRMFCWSATLELAAFALAAAVAAGLLRRGQPLWRAAGMAAGQGDDVPRASCACCGPVWFAAAQAAVVAVAAVLAVWIALDYAFDGVGRQATILATLRVVGRPASILALLMLLGTAILMAREGATPWRARWQYAAIGLFALLGAAAGWAVLPEGAPAPWLHRSVVAMTAAAVAVFVASFALRTFLPAESDWIERGKRSVLPLAAAAATALAAVLIGEGVQTAQFGGTAMMPWAIALVGAALAGLAAASIALAVWPQLDPLELDDRRRQIYVYAAEAILALLGLHVRFTMPWLFHGFFQRYWMLVVMAVAFCGAGLAEWFHRRKMPVLAEPLWRTALVLPLAPAVGFWFLGHLTAQSALFSLTGQTPLLWFFMGAFYATLAATRRSAGCAALAVLSFNLALWVALYQHDVAFLQHPQLWLIPLALAGLVAEHLSGARLSETQRTGFRYLMLAVIYVSSSADMFIVGVARIGDYWWLPLILMVLSVVGALVGILLRIRSFLALGVAFLLLDIVSIIWYAAVDLQHTWIWYACGIFLGAAIIALFAVFEKRRNDVLSAVERLKDWKR